MPSHFHRGFRGVALLSALLLVLALPASAQTSSPEELRPQNPSPAPAESAGGDEVAEDLWFVELPSPSVAQGGNAARTRADKAAFRAEARAQGVPFTERRAFDTAWNGLSVRATDEVAGVLSRLRTVQAVYPVALVSIPDVTEAPEMFTARSMTGADNVVSELGYTGEGVRVAIMDTGIDYQHPDLGGDGVGTSFPTARVVAGWDFVGDDFNAAAADPNRRIPRPNPDPLDIGGHGTHVAGIVGADAAGDDGVTGVAPGVTFGAYKVFGTEGSTTADVMIAAMEMALADDMDVLNMSIGSARSWPQYPTAVAADSLVERGMVVVASIGNSGAEGAYAAGAPGLGERVIGVASADNTVVRARSFLVDPDTEAEQAIAYQEMSDAPAPPTAGESDPLVWAGRACPTLGDAVPDLSGSTALIVRGDCTFNEKYRAAVTAGATGVIIYNNAPGLFAGGGIVPVDDVWAAAIGRADGMLLRGPAETEDDVTVVFSKDLVETANPTGGLVSSFSSYGHSPDLSLKPDILAPGGLITAPYPLARGGYATISGTSMSSPHVAGAAALLMEAEPALPVEDYRDRLQNTAEPVAWSGNPGLGFLEHTFRQGAGMLQIDDAITATTGVAPSKLTLREGTDAKTETLTVRNDGDAPVTYAVSHTGALSTAGSTFTPAVYAGFASFTGPSQVSVPAGGSADVTVTITPPDAGLANHQYGGYVVFADGDGEAPTLRVPYGGFDGDYQSLALFGFISNVPGDVTPRLPRLGRVVDGALAPAGEGERFAVRQGDLPVVAAFFGHHAQRVELIAHRQQGNQRHTVLVQEHHVRSAHPNHHFAFSWDGTVPASASDQTRPAPQGTYTLELRALKALGDPANPAHWETWTSPSFTIPQAGGQGRN
jgi:minor extracellular serine protease Vpr